LEGLAREDDGIFFGHLVHFTVFCYILWTFGIVRSNLVYFSPFGILYREKSGNPGIETYPRLCFQAFATPSCCPEVPRWTGRRGRVSGAKFVRNRFSGRKVPVSEISGTGVDLTVTMFCDQKTFREKFGNFILKNGF
jgi:hypothetical protein